MSECDIINRLRVELNYYLISREIYSTKYIFNMADIQVCCANLVLFEAELMMIFVD